MDVSSAAMIEQLTDGASMLGASRDAGHRPCVSRVVAVRLSDDRTTLTAYVADRAGAELIRVATPGAPFAVTVSQVHTYRTVQVKGTVVAARPARDDERPRIEAQAGGFVRALSVVGFPVPVVARLVTWPATAIEVRIEAVFEQTPGPGAGRRVGAT